MPSLRDFLELRDQLESRGVFTGALATSVGPKIVRGKQTRDLSVQIIVGRKLRLDETPRGEFISPTYDGLPTDVLRGGGEIVAIKGGIPARASYVAGCGTSIKSDKPAYGTVTCWGRTEASERRLLTAAHVVRPQGRVFDSRQPPRPLGTVVQRIRYATGRELYGSWAQANPEMRFCVDLATLRPARGVRTGFGLPGGGDFIAPEATRTAVRWLRRQPAIAFGGTTRVWRNGVIVGFWPRRVNASAAGFLNVQQEPRSQAGDSGSLWLVRRAGTWMAIGLHWGVVRSYAFVTDLWAGMRLAQVRDLAGRSRVTS